MSINQIWRYDCEGDRKSLADRAAQTALNFASQYADLLFRDYGPVEYRAGIDFLKRTKKAFDVGIDEKIKLFKEKSQKGE